jgi:GWxTD domain-containing protein
MNALESWVHTSLATVIGWTLLHSLWEGALIAGVLACALWLSHRASAGFRYALACLALLAMPVAFGVTLAILYPGAPVRMILPNIPFEQVRGSPLAAPASPLSWSDRLAWVAPFWLTGVCCFYIYRLGSWLAAQRLRRTGTCAAPQLWQDIVRKLAQRIGVSRPVALLESCLADVPIVVGYLRPVILVPLGMLMELPSEQAEAILLHELSHILRADYLANLLQTVVEGLLFYHPATWWISGVVRAEREHCCDDAVVALQGNAQEYAAALLTLEQRRWRAPESALAANGGKLLPRVRRLLSKPDGLSHRAPIMAAGLFVILLGSGLIMRQPAAANPQAAGLPQAWPEIARLNFVNQADDDEWLIQVKYIIQPAEREAYSRLKTAAERQQFIQQFWDRRDPTPGTPVNEFRDDYERRLAFAAEHFKDGGIPGFDTPRAQFYMTWGPPDEIDEHGDGTTWYSDWTYRYLEGLGADVNIRFTAFATYRLVAHSPLATFEGAPTGATPPIPGLHVSVQVYPRGFVTFSIPTGFTSAAVGSTQELRSSDGASLFSYRVFTAAGAGSNGTVAGETEVLPPGSYTFLASLSDKDANQSYSEVVNFEVK